MLAPCLLLPLEPAVRPRDSAPAAGPPIIPCRAERHTSMSAKPIGTVRDSTEDFAQSGTQGDVASAKHGCMNICKRLCSFKSHVRTR